MTQPVDASGQWVYPVSPPLAAGEVLVASQQAGAVSSDPTDPITVLANIPAAPELTGIPYHEDDVAVHGIGIVGATVTLFINAANAGTTMVSGDGTWTVTVTPLVAGQVLSAWQTTAGGTSALSGSTEVEAAPITPPPPGSSGYLSLESAGAAGDDILLETGDRSLLETGDTILLEGDLTRLLFEFGSSASMALLEIGDDILHENSDRTQLDGAAFDGTTTTDLMLLENVGAPVGGTGVLTPRTNQSGTGRYGSRQPR